MNVWYAASRVVFPALSYRYPVDVSRLFVVLAVGLVQAGFANDAATAGVGAVVAGPASAASSLSIVPKVENVATKTTGLQRQLQLHQDKLTEYARNPYAHDNKGHLLNSPESRHAKIIQGRVRNLVQQIRNYERQIK